MKTHILFILDESSSMDYVQKEVIHSINRWLADRKTDAALSGADISMTLVKFGDKPRPVFALKALSDVPEINTQTYDPMGNTALWATIQHGIESLRDNVGPDDRALVVILTDGYENASTYLGVEEASVAKLIRDLTDQGNWTFTGIMAENVDSKALTSLGVPEGNIEKFEVSYQGTQTAFASNSTSTSNYLSSNLRSTADFYTKNS